MVVNSNPIKVIGKRIEMIGMNTRLIYWWDQLRDKLWFIPSLFCAAALLAAACSLILDRTLFENSSERLSFFTTTGASGRIVLGSLISALVTVVGLAFSLTMLALSQTSSQYGPRLVRTLFDSNVTQNVLGLFLGTTVFCMVVLRSIRDLDSSGELFTPNLSIFMAELLSATCMFGLLKLSSHMTQCMRAETLLKTIHTRLITSTQTIYPDGSADSNRKLAPKSTWQPIDDGHTVCGEDVGYMQAVNLDLLTEIAERHGHRLELLKRPGDFIHHGVVLMNVAATSSNPITDEIREEYVDGFLIGSIRTSRQDIEAALLELVEAGIRALSPGVNDPITAINVIDYVSSFLRSLTHRNLTDTVILDHQDQPIILADRASFSSILNAGFDQLRQYADSSVAVHCRLLEGLAAIAEVASRQEDCESIRRQCQMILRHAETHIGEQQDLKDVQERALIVDEHLLRPSPTISS